MFERARSTLHRVRRAVPFGFGRTSYAQEGEDLILARIFESQQTGTYVDVGAHHPQRFSNTYLLYKRGWRGVNIDATPGSMSLFQLVRPHDINLEIGVTAKAEERDFYLFDEPALNTFDAERARSLSQYKIESVRRVRCAPLSQILRDHAIATLDLLTIDAEGFDFEVLQTLDWDATKPRVVLIEQFSRDMQGLVDTETHRYLHDRGYRLIAKTWNSVFYRAEP
ncbi:MAG: FkbM family methyltransferase [Myxococcota bacterium]|nr:FkbM family methyltransferase [Myxococcota bacterium]